MKKLISHRLKAGMSFEDCLLLISDNIIGLLIVLPEICKKAKDMVRNERGDIGVLSMADAMEIYGNDLAIMFSRVCQKDDIKFLTIIWAFEVGNQVHNTPTFAKLETIKKFIKDEGRGDEYPFQEAQAFIEKSCHIRFPVADFSFLEEGNVLFRMIKDAWAFIFDKNARTLSQFTFPNGNLMSIRDAKRAGLIQA